MNEDIEWLKNMKLDESRGQVEIVGIRSTFVGSNSFRAYREGIAEITGPGAADAVLYLAGKKYAKDYVGRMLKTSLVGGFAKRFSWGREKMVEKILTIMTEYGFGKTYLEKLDLEGETVIMIENSCVAYSYDKRQKACVCSHLGGVISGGAEAITGKPYLVRETHCIAKGDKHCRFTAVPENIVRTKKGK